jgi:hypothetical protein
VAVCTQHATNTRNDRLCSQRDSSPRSQQSSGCSPAHSTPSRSVCTVYTYATKGCDVTYRYQESAGTNRMVWHSLSGNTDMRPLTTGIRSEKCVVRRFRRRAHVIQYTYTNLDSVAYYTPRLYGIASLLLLGYKPVQHVTVLNTVGNCDTMVSIIILWDHRRICGPSLTETSLCAAYLCNQVHHQYIAPIPVYANSPTCFGCYLWSSSGRTST